MTAASTLMPWTPLASIVFRSAWIPAPRRNRSPRSSAHAVGSCRHPISHYSVLSPSPGWVGPVSRSTSTGGGSGVGVVGLGFGLGLGLVTTGCGCGREVAWADSVTFGEGLGEGLRGVGEGGRVGDSLGVGTTTSSVPPEVSLIPATVRQTTATTATPEITAIRRDRASVDGCAPAPSARPGPGGLGRLTAGGVALAVGPPVGELSGGRRAAAGGPAEESRAARTGAVIGPVTGSWAARGSVPTGPVKGPVEGPPGESWTGPVNGPVEGSTGDG